MSSIITLIPVKKSTPCCPLTSKSTLMFLYNCLGLFLLESVLRIFYSIQFKLNEFFTGESNIIIGGLVVLPEATV